MIPSRLYPIAIQIRNMLMMHGNKKVSESFLFLSYFFYCVGYKKQLKFCSWIYNDAGLLLRVLLGGKRTANLKGPSVHKTAHYSAGLVTKFSYFCRLLVRIDQRRLPTRLTEGRRRPKWINSWLMHAIIRHLRRENDAVIIVSSSYFSLNNCHGMCFLFDNKHINT